jgi:S1-C subfamily serine protease
MGPPPRSIFGPLITFGGTALGLAALVGVGLYVTGTGLGQQASNQISIDAPLPPETESSLVSLSREPASDGDADDEAASDTSAEGDTSAGAGDDADDSIRADSVSPTDLDGVDDPPADDGVNTTTSTAAEAPPPHQEPAASATEPVDLLAAERLPPDATASDGVYGLIDGEQLERLAGFVVVDGLIFTTGSSVGDRVQVAVRSSGVWTEANLVGVDQVSDVAVFTVADPSRLDVDYIVTADDDEASGHDVSWRNTRVALAATGSSRAITGVVTAVDQPATVEGGRAIYGAIRTSIARRHDADGAALVDRKGGHLVGLVVDAHDPLLSAIPTSTLQRVGQAYATVGAPAVEWLGVAGVVRPEGGVIITRVPEGGPADAVGLSVGKAIVAVDGQAVVDMNHLAHLVRRAGVGTTIRLRVVAGTTTTRVDVAVGVRPPGPSGP